MSQHTGARSGYLRGGWVRNRMRPHRRDEPHRSATALELLFDLVFVVAVARAGGRLAHAAAEGHLAAGLLSYLLVFFAIWWAWMNFTWFASAYDTDDAPYRLATFVQMTGVLVLAAGVPRAFDDGDWTLVLIGYVIIRAVLVGQWLRAAAAETGDARRSAQRYAAGVGLCQLGWCSLVLLPASTRPWLFPVMVVAELSVPVIAERGRITPWNPRHIAERYGLFTLIVLGETVAASAVAVQSAIDDPRRQIELLPVAAGGLVLVFAAWSVYFAVPAAEHLASRTEAFLWGYGHFFIFASAAAIGAGMEVTVETVTHHADLSARAAALMVTAPMAVFLLTTWLLHTRTWADSRSDRLIPPVAAALVLATTLAGIWAVPIAGAVAALAIVATIAASIRRDRADRGRHTGG